MSKEIINTLKGKKERVIFAQLIDYVIALQLEQVLKLDNMPEAREDAMANLIELLKLR
ncbi:MAG: hypothetical protein J6M91_09345 [Methanobrevibacter sp.]|nr:hypothetical protein [Methanobrevibacter sp.]